MTYTSTKALQYLSISSYTVLKNLAIIIIAYGEVLWFAGHVPVMAVLAFALMGTGAALVTWADALAVRTLDGELSIGGAARLRMGIFWMGLSVVATAGYVLGMRKVIQRMHFKDWDSEFFLCFSVEKGIGSHLGSHPGSRLFFLFNDANTSPPPSSNVLQQPPLHANPRFVLAPL